MAKNNWASISLPENYMLKLDELIESNDFKELQLTSRSKIIIKLLEMLFDNGISTLNNKQNDDFQKEILKRLQKLEEKRFGSTME